MDNQGIVIKVDDIKKTAEIKVVRQSACGSNCKSCGSCEKRFATANCSNEIGAKIGQTVRFHASTSKILLISFLVYMMPIALFIICYLSTNSLIFSLITFILYGFLNYFIDKKIIVEHKIIEILDK